MKVIHDANSVLILARVHGMPLHSVKPTIFTDTRQREIVFKLVRSAKKLKRLTPMLKLRNLHTSVYTGRERLIRSHSSARFSFELSGNSN